MADGRLDESVDINGERRSLRPLANGCLIVLIGLMSFSNSPIWASNDIVFPERMSSPKARRPPAWLLATVGLALVGALAITPR